MNYDETNDDPSKVPNGNTQDSFEDISQQISTDEILKMYETEDLIEE